MRRIAFHNNSRRSSLVYSSMDTILKLVEGLHETYSREALVIHEKGKGSREGIEGGGYGSSSTIPGRLD